MKKYNRLIFTFLLCFIPTVAYANSSWYWVSETRPYDVLPVVIALTLIIETVSVVAFAGAKNHKLKVFIVVLIGNLLSFGAPYLLAATDILYTFNQMLEHTPLYNVGIAYLVVTLVIEMPIVYNTLKKDVKSRKKLLFTILFSNVITTLITYIAERIFCYGKW